MLDQVPGSFLDGCYRSLLEAAGPGHQAHTLGELTTAATLQQSDELMLDPRLGLWGSFLVEGVGRTPQVFDDMDDVEHDGDRRTHVPRRAFDPQDLVPLTIDEDNPAAAQGRIASERFGERVIDHFLSGALQARPYPLVRRPRSHDGPIIAQPV